MFTAAGVGKLLDSLTASQENRSNFLLSTALKRRVFGVTMTMAASQIIVEGDPR